MTVIQITGQLYTLYIDRWIDKRRNPHRLTRDSVSCLLSYGYADLTSVFAIIRFVTAENTTTKESRQKNVRALNVEPRSINYYLNYC